MAQQTPLELVQMYQDLLRHEQRTLNETLERIAEYGEKLAKAADAARQG